MISTEKVVQLENATASESGELPGLMKDVAGARRLSPDELGKLAEKLVEATDPDEVLSLKKEFFNGFYGTADA